MIRGNERKNLFLDDQDRLYFMEILKSKKENNRYKLHVFCIMDNHVHLLLQEGEEGIANIMKRINISYVFYFNKKYQRIGHLFQDRYRSEKIEQDNYLLAVVRYIHRNPVKAGMVQNVEEYPWSSYREYILEDVIQDKIGDTEMILGIFSGNKEEAKREFIRFMNEEEPERFLEMNEKVGIMPEAQARELWRELAGKELELAKKLKLFRIKTNLTFRKMAEITGINKDLICKITK